MEEYGRTYSQRQLQNRLRIYRDTLSKTPEITKQDALKLYDNTVMPNQDKWNSKAKKMAAAFKYIIGNEIEKKFGDNNILDTNIFGDKINDYVKKIGHWDTWEVLDLIDAPRNAIVNGITNAQETQERGGKGNVISLAGSFFSGLGQGFVNKRKSYGINVAKNMGIKNPTAAFTVGLAYDILEDPLTYAGMAAENYIKGLKSIRNVTKVTGDKKIAKELLANPDFKKGWIKLGSKRAKIITKYSKYLRKWKNLMDKYGTAAKIPAKYKSGLLPKLVEYTKKAKGVSGEYQKLFMGIESDTAGYLGKGSMGAVNDIAINHGVNINSSNKETALNVVDDITGQKKINNLKNIKYQYYRGRIDPDTLTKSKLQNVFDFKKADGGIKVPEDILKKTSGIARFDMDKFKILNEKTIGGHGSADVLVGMVGQAADKILGDTGNLYRVGGDEFMIAFKPGVDTKTQAKVMYQIHNAFNGAIEKLKDYEIIAPRAAKKIGHLTLSSGLINGDKLVSETEKALTTGGKYGVFEHLSTVTDDLATKGKELGRNIMIINKYPTTAEKTVQQIKNKSFNALMSGIKNFGVEKNFIGELNTTVGSSDYNYNRRQK